jgi:uncharacterized protein (TIGR03089 family)
MSSRDPLSALAELLRTNPTQPLVTYHDGSTGERVELSVVTVDNWVNKVANLVAGDLGLEADATFAMELPAHWQTAVTVLGGWAAGLCLTSSHPDVDLLIVGPAALDAEVDGRRRPGEVVASALRPLGGRFQRPLPAGWWDFAVEVPPQADRLLEPRPMSDPATTLSRPRAAQELMDDAAEAADTLGLRAGGRLLTDLNPATEDGLVRGLCACLAVGASLVLVAGTDPAAVDRLAEQERITCRAWTAARPAGQPRR